MFQPPKTTTYVAPAEPIDVNQRYLLRVHELIDLGPSKFPQPNDNPDDPTHRIQWKFQMATMDGQKVLDVDGNPYYHHDYTSSKTGKSTKAGGKTSTARMWMEALFGKPLEDDEIGPDIATELRGKVAVALFEEKDKESQSGEAYTQLRILRLSPRKQNGAAMAAEERKAAAENAQATVSRARTAVVEKPKPAEATADNDLPF